MRKFNITWLSLLVAAFTLLNANVFSQDTIKAITDYKISDTQGSLPDTLDNSDFFGVPTVIGDLNGDGVTELAIGIMLDDEGGSNRGAVTILFMNQDGTVDSSQKIAHNRGGLSYSLHDDERFGRHLEGIGDLDDDGIPDLAVGAYFNDNGGNRAGALYILFLNSDGTVKSDTRISDTEQLGGVLDAGDNFGSYVSNIGDFNGDGNEEIAVGAQGDDDGGPQRGAFYILFLDDTAAVDSTVKISDTQGDFTGTLDDVDLFGLPEGIGDLNQDGVPDLAVGSERDDDCGFDAGCIWILFMQANGRVDTFQKITETEGDFGGTIDNQDFFMFPTNAGDLNGDGINDIVVGAGGDDDGGTNRGTSWILIMGTDGKVDHEYKINDIHGNFDATLDDGDGFGSRSDIIDFDGDGKSDLIACALGDDDGGTSRGAFYIVTLNSFDHNADIAILKKKLDGGHHVAKGEKLKFRYTEDYFYDDPGTLVYNFYDRQHAKVASLPSQDVIKGTNHYEIDLSAINGMTHSQYYTLEVVNSKNEKRYLRFYDQHKDSGLWTTNGVFTAN